MFNVTIFNIKDVFKYVITTAGMIFIILSISKNLNNYKNTNSSFIENITKESFLVCLDESVPTIKEVNNKDSTSVEKIINDESVFLKLLKVELSSYGFIDKNEDVEIGDFEETINNDVSVQNTELKEDNNEEQIEISEVETTAKTEVVTKNPLPNAFNTTYNTVKIKNETSFNLTNEILNPNVEFNRKDIIIFHTHSCESYTASEKYPYTPTGNFRTTDKKYSVCRVGDELTAYLKNYGYNVTHDTTYHDYPNYTGSYNRSMKTVQNILNTHKSDIIIDLHRDAIGSNSSYAPTVKINDEEAAQLMFVIGSNGGGLNHPNWDQNLKFAIKVQEKANEIYPDLFKPIILRNSRYNQQLGKAACIIEVGSTGNTLEQCLTSMKYLSKVLDEVLK